MCDEPMSSENGTSKTVKARFWPWLQGEIYAPFECVPSSLESGDSMDCGYLEKGIQIPMAQGQSSKITSMIRWIRTSRLSIMKFLSLAGWQGTWLGSDGRDYG